ncbi:MAG: polyhydroxyalkanoate granule-associated phasin [Variovorax sp.]
MPTQSPSFKNPLSLWADIALKTSEMLWSSASVIQMRSTRMAAHGVQPNASDVREMQLMGQEKLSAGAAAGNAMFAQMQRTNALLLQQFMEQSAKGLSAWLSFAGSRTPAQAMARGRGWLEAAGRAGRTSAQLSDAVARVTGHGLAPVHRAATANARRLSRKKS